MLDVNPSVQRWATVLRNCTWKRNTFESKNNLEERFILFKGPDVWGRQVSKSVIKEALSCLKPNGRPPKVIRLRHRNLSFTTTWMSLLWEQPLAQVAVENRCLQVTHKEEITAQHPQEKSSVASLTNTTSIMWTVHRVCDRAVTRPSRRNKSIFLFLEYHVNDVDRVPMKGGDAQTTNEPTV